MLITIGHNLWGLTKQVANRVQNNRSIAAGIVVVNAAIVAGVVALGWSVGTILRVYWLAVAIELAFGMLTFVPVVYATQRRSQPGWRTLGATLVATGKVWIFWISLGGLLVAVANTTTGDSGREVLYGIDRVAALSLASLVVIQLLHAVQTGYPERRSVSLSYAPPPLDPTYLGPSLMKLAVIPVTLFVVLALLADISPVSAELTVLMTLMVCDGLIEFHRQLDVDRFFGDFTRDVVDDLS